MSAFSPEVPPIPQSSQADLLGRFVPTGFRRMPPVAKIWRLPRLVLLAVATAGFYPLRALQVRLRQTQMFHAQQCDLASQLFDQHLPADEAAIIRDAAKGVRVHFGVLNISAVLMLAALAMLVVWLGQRGFSQDAFAQWWLHGPPVGDWIALASGALLVSACMLLFVQINMQIVAMQKLALAINAIDSDDTAARNDVRPIDLPPLVYGLKIPHLVLGFVGGCFGLYWAFPLMLAWAAFTSFVRDSAFRFRVQLAERLGGMSGVDPVIPLSELCPNPDCRLSLPLDAEFCPRCGAAISR